MYILLCLSIAMYLQMYRVTFIPWSMKISVVCIFYSLYLDTYVRIEQQMYIKAQKQQRTTEKSNKNTQKEINQRQKLNMFLN